MLKKYVAFVIFFVSLIVVGYRTNLVFAEGPVQIEVKTVLASNDKPFSDSRISHLIPELQSVFRYSSYKLLSQNSMRLNIGQSGTAGLPGGITLNITPMQIAGNRAQLKVEILRGGSQIFQTVIQLLNRASMTVGGPQHEGGYLLFNISSSF